VPSRDWFAAWISQGNITEKLKGNFIWQLFVNSKCLLRNVWSVFFLSDSVRQMHVYRLHECFQFKESAT
jgi:hypothetical protein